MSITAFSAQRFYQVATGSPVDRSCTHIVVDTQLPQSGLNRIDAAPDGTTHIAWLQGVVAPTKQRERFIQDIELRTIPCPSSRSENLSSLGRAHYLSLSELQSQNRTVASLLGATDALADAATQSRMAQCPTCKHLIHIFHAPSELCDEITRSWSGKAIELELVGACDSIETWAREHGFTPRSQDQNLATVRLDSFKCDQAHAQQLQSLIGSTRQLADTWLLVRSESNFEEYAWHGRCSRCRHTMRAFQKSAARSIIERASYENAAVEASRLLEGVPLRELLMAPLNESLANSTTTNLLSSQQRDALETLGLTGLTFGTRTNTLSPLSLASLALVAHASVVTRSNDIVIFDAPCALFPEQEYNAALAVAEGIAQHTPVVWLAEPRQPDAPPSFQREHPTEGLLLGTIELQGSSPSFGQIQCGGWLSLPQRPHLRHERLGLALHKAIQGGPSQLFTFSAARPFSAHFIPLFAQDSSATRLVAHQLGALEPLAKMFAASHEAKMLGLSSRDFTIGQLKLATTLCGTCRGAGLLHAKDGDLWREEVGPCPACWGTRFRSPVRDVTFKGKTLWEILSTSIASSEQTLRALPKMKDVFELATLLGLSEVALGTPTTLLHTHQRRLLAIAHAMLEATATKPSIIVIEAPFVGLSAQQREGLQKVVEHPRFKDRVAWIGVEG